MREITDAVVLMAGTGSRLRASGELLPKPLVPILGRPLISYIAESLANAGVQTLHAIVGANSDSLVESLRQLIPATMQLNPIRNPDWQKQNGVSVLCAAGNVAEPFFLTMGDHLFDPAILHLVLKCNASSCLGLAIDKKLETIFDIDDAMKVQTTGDGVATLGKDLETYDAIDTGIFLCPEELFDYLRRVQRDGDCSLADGVRLMASDGMVRAIDIGAFWWQDVDTPEMRAHAEEHLRDPRAAQILRAAEPKMECIVLVDHPAASVELCGISMMERSLRTLQACGFTRALILTDSEELMSEAARAASPRWTKIVWNFAARRTGPVTLEHLAAVWPDGRRDLLVLRGDSVFDARLLRLLRAQDSLVALVDSAVPAKLLPLVSSAPMTNRGRLCGAALLSRDWVSGRSAPLEEALCAGLENGSLLPFDVATQSWYCAELHRDLRAYWFPFSSPAHNKLVENVILDAAQKGTLDIPALVHAPIENFIVGKLCKTTATPNQLTIFCNIIAWGATILFATGHLGWGIAVALAVGVLDGLDGKLARAKLEMSKAGKLEHFFDVVFENSWWIALAYHLHVSGKLPDAFFYLGLLIGAEVLNALARTGIVRSYGKSISELARFDRIFRLIGGRRNVYVWIFALGLIMGTPAGAFKLIARWEAVTATVHLARTAWALWAFRSQSAPR